MEPQRAVLRIEVQAFLADLQRLVELTFSLFVAGSLEVEWAIRLALVHEDSELGSSGCLVADASLEEGTFKQHAPRLLDRHVGELGDQVADFLMVAKFLLNFDGLDKQVFVQVRELEALDENFS